MEERGTSEQKNRGISQKGNEKIALLTKKHSPMDRALLKIRKICNLETFSLLFLEITQAQKQFSQNL